MANTNVRSEEDTLLGSFSGWAVAAVVAGIPAILGILQVLSTAKGDQQVVRAILTDLNLTSLLASLFLDALKSGVFVVGLSLLPMLRRLNSRKRADPRLTPAERAQFIALAGVGLVLSTNTLRTGAVIVVSGGFLVAGRYLSAQANMHSHARRRALGEYGAVCLLALLVVGAAMLSVRSSWLPLEAVKITGSAPGRAYVLSTNDNVVSYIFENGTLVRTKVSEVESVALCPESAIGPNGPIHRYWHPSLIEVLLKGRPAPVPDGCLPG